MIDKISVRSLIENSKTQIENCEIIMEVYWDDPDQREAFENKIIHYKFMIERLQTFL